MCFKTPQDACPADSGVGLQQEEEAAVNDIIEQLEEVGQHQVRLMKFASAWKLHDSVDRYACFGCAGPASP